MSMKPAVSASGLEVELSGNLALAASDFSIPAGAVSAVIGPNGAGKSTLLNVVAGLLPDFKGHVEVLGRRPEKSSMDISYVLQATKVNDRIPISVSEVVAMGRYSGKGLMTRLGSQDRLAVDKALDRLDIASLRRRSLHQLSSGQRQRVFVAQGLAQDHRLLLLDEPMVGLDLVSTGAIERVIEEERAEGKTVVLTTHDLAQALSADWAILLAGRVVAAGPPGEALDPDNLALAYGLKVVQTAEGRYVVDDPAHGPVGTRHVHRVQGHGHKT
jgi:iron complex transport system ATP-binding protein